jgi:hypothetical protein
MQRKYWLKITVPGTGEAAVTLFFSLKTKKQEPRTFDGEKDTGGRR